jgi:hypothetical protein
MEIEKLSARELKSLRGRIDRRLLEVEGQEGKSLAELFSGAQPVELIALAVMQTGIRCRTQDGRSVTLRPGSGIRGEAEAHILTVQPNKTWTFQRTTYLAGKFIGMRLDVAALKLTPLKLKDEGLWDPKEAYWGEPGDEIHKCFRPIIAAGPRPSFEMEQILPGLDPDDIDSDPITEAVDLYEAGKVVESERALHRCLEEDLRTLDAHAHLGNWAFDDASRKIFVEKALRNYQAGVAIGDLSLTPAFTGVLEWGRIDNRPYLRCLHGLGLCRWVLGDMKGAREVFERMLWLNPSDNQGVRFCLCAVADGKSYEELEEPMRARKSS